tara:strand:- start:13019 stop:14020 length:1002 start_codon:yes stop_codon:yes gene_type:complete
MNILLTGGLGYIGSHVAVTLLNAGYEVFIVDNLINSDIETLEKIEKITNRKVYFNEIDIRNTEGLNKIFDSNNLDAVIHLSGLKAVGESVLLPLEYYSSNVSGSINLFKVMQAHNVKKIVFSSSATVYGNPQYLPIDEDHPIDAINPYGSTKIMIENILSDLSDSDNDWSFISLRYFNPIGSHESGIIGDNPVGIPNNLMPYILKVHNGEIDHLRVFGNDYNTPDGTGIRDYIHIEDLAKGHLDALESIVNNDRLTDFINLGTGKGSSVMEVVEAFETVSNKKIPYKIFPKRDGDAESCYADVRKAKKVLQWESKHDLISMCNSVYKYSKSTT